MAAAAPSGYISPLLSHSERFQAALSRLLSDYRDTLLRFDRRHVQPWLEATERHLEEAEAHQAQQTEQQRAIQAAMRDFQLKMQHWQQLTLGRTAQPKARGAAAAPPAARGAGGGADAAAFGEGK